MKILNFDDSSPMKRVFAKKVEADSQTRGLQIFNIFRTQSYPIECIVKQFHVSTKGTAFFADVNNCNLNGRRILQNITHF